MLVAIKPDLTKLNWDPSMLLFVAHGIFNNKEIPTLTLAGDRIVVPCKD